MKRNGKRGELSRMNNIIEDNYELIGEKVIKPMFEDGYFPLTLAHEIANAIEKQIPKKPINHYDCHWLCPICNKLICDNSYGVEEEYKFCNMCGQAIDWRNEDELNN